ncbi:hypothetical protein KBC55_02005 [Patescibacteria group bacterium]|nr:hypothetical protein [Patescibacteria group bacterium]
MNLRHYLFIIALGGLASLAAFCVTLLMINPLTAGLVGFIAFYITLFFSILGFFTFLGTLIRMARTGDDSEKAMNTAVARSLRQAIFLAAFVLALLALTNAGVMGLPTLLFCIGLVGALEYAFLTFAERDSSVQAGRDQRG